MGLLDYFYPPSCAICGRERHPAATASFLCPDCADFRGRPRFGDSVCARCAEPLPFSGARAECVLCGAAPLIPDVIWSAYDYEGTLESLLKLYKYGGGRHLGKILGDVFAAAATSNELLLSSPAETVIVPVSSPLSHLRRRGFHHLMPLARELSRVTLIPLRPFALRPLGDREPQVALTPAERRKNVAGAFSARAKDAAGKRILLVDDVVTTGATLDAAAEALHAAGALAVTAITLARSRQFVHHRMEAVFNRVV